MVCEIDYCLILKKYIFECMNVMNYLSYFI